MDPAGKPAGTALVPVAGSLPFEQLTPDLRFTMPVAVTVKWQGVLRLFVSTLSETVPPQGPCGMMVSFVTSTYFFSAVTLKAHAGPMMAGETFGIASRRVTLGTNVVPAGHVPSGVVGT